MRFDRISPKIYLGSCPTNEQDVERLHREVGITGVVNVQTDSDLRYMYVDWGEMERHYAARGIEVRRVPARDFDRNDLRRKLSDCAGAVHELIAAGHTVYIHCSAGINRSPSTVIAYLHWYEDFGFDEAVEYVTARRNCDPYVDAIRLATQDRAAGPLPD
jgi:protein-tyrosine phosphatase